MSFRKEKKVSPLCLLLFNSDLFRHDCMSLEEFKTAATTVSWQYTKVETICALMLMDMCPIKDHQLFLFLQTSLFIYIHTYMCIHTYIHIRMCMHTCMPVCFHACMHIFIYTYSPRCAYINIHVHTFCSKLPLIASYFQDIWITRQLTSAWWTSRLFPDITFAEFMLQSDHFGQWLSWWMSSKITSILQILPHLLFVRHSVCN